MNKTESVFVSKLRALSEEVFAATKRQKLLDDMLKQADTMEILIDELNFLNQLIREYEKKDQLWGKYSQEVYKECSNTLPSHIESKFKKVLEQKDKIDELVLSYQESLEEYNDEIRE